MAAEFLAKPSVHFGILRYVLNGINSCRENCVTVPSASSGFLRDLESLNKKLRKFINMSSFFSFKCR